MKTFIRIQSFLLGLVVLASCEAKVNKDLVWPQWASRPLVEDASLTSLTGGKSVNAGDIVKFSAHVYDDYSDLASYTLEFKANNAVIASVAGTLSGSSADIYLETEMPFGAYYAEGAFYPEVSLCVTNVVKGKTEKRLDNDHNVSVVRPATPDRLYIVDNLGQTFVMERQGKSYDFKTSASLAPIGRSFWIAEKVVSGKPDFSSLVWGKRDGNYMVVKSGEGTEIPTPSSQGYGIKDMRFSMYSFEISKLVNHTVEIDWDKMEPDIKGGAHYRIMNNVALVRDCQVVFKGFPDVKNCLQTDRFADIEAGSARFTGPSRPWRFFYNEDNKWLIVNTYNNEDDLVWVTGKNAGYPLEPHTDCQFDWFGTEPHGYLSAVKVTDDEYIFRLQLYLESNFELKLYSWVAWAMELTWHSVTPQTLTVNDENYGLAGSTFKPGVYMLTYNKYTQEASLEKQN